MIANIEFLVLTFANLEIMSNENVKIHRKAKNGQNIIWPTKGLGVSEGSDKKKPTYFQTLVKIVDGQFEQDPPENFLTDPFLSLVF